MKTWGTIVADLTKGDDSHQHVKQNRGLRGAEGRWCSLKTQAGGQNVISQEERQKDFHTALGIQFLSEIIINNFTLSLWYFILFILSFLWENIKKQISPALHRHLFFSCFCPNAGNFCSSVSCLLVQITFMEVFNFFFSFFFFFAISFPL